MNRPSFVTDEHMEYLDALRESGAVNMFGAGNYLVEFYGMNRHEAREAVTYWMKTYKKK